MTTYPLEYYLNTVGTPNIKIVDWNAWFITNDNDDYCAAIWKSASERKALSGICDVLKIMTRLGKLDPVPGNDLAPLVRFPIVIAEDNSDEHLLLRLTYGSVEWHELPKDEADSLLQASGDTQ